jgi:ABC-2 type transport system ATP-binding protein
MDAIEARDLYKKFDSVEALRGISFSVPEGSLFGLIGADGAGKTTMLRILVTLLSADKGSATVLGKSVEKEYASIRSVVGYMPQRFSLYGDLSVGENLKFFADVFGISVAERKTRIDRLLSFSKLGLFINRRVARLSGGMKQKLALSCALIHTPRLLVLDEPTTGVDPVSRKEFWDILFDLKKQGITILVSTPYMDEAALCDSLLLLHKGEVLKQGSPAELIAGYPHTLYRISSAAGGITVPATAPAPAGVALMYPHAGALHVAVRDRTLAAPTLLPDIRKLAPAADAIALAQPDIEDLLFALLYEKEAA